MLLLVVTVIATLAQLNDAYDPRAQPSRASYIRRPLNTGVIVSALTPVNEDQTLNLDIIPEYADYLYNIGVRIVMITGNDGEGMALSLDDCQRLVDAWLDARRNTGIDVWVQVGGGPLPENIELARYSVDRGASCIVTLPDLYYTPESIDDLVFYLSLVANEIPNTPLIYYHSPNKTGVDLFMPDFVRAADVIPNFQGIKFADNDFVQMDQTFRALQDNNKELYIAQESLILPAAVLGVTSAITSSVFPDLVIQIFDNVAAGNLRAAQEIQNTLTSLVEATTVPGTDRFAVPAKKAAFQLVSGLDMGPPLLPQRELSIAEYNQLKYRLLTLGYGCNGRRGVLT